MEQYLYLPALKLASDAEQMYAEGKLEQVRGLTHVADFNLQFIIHGMQDTAAEEAKANSLANPTDRPMFGKAIQFSRQGLALIKTRPLNAQALFRLAAIYLKLAENWEPSADDEQTRQEFAKLDGFINRQLEATRKAALSIQSEPK